MRRRLILSLALCLLLTACSTVAEYASPVPSPEGSAAPAPSASAPPEETAAPAPEWGEQVYMTAYAVEGRPEPVFAPEYRLPEIENAQGVSAYEAINAYYAAALDDLASSAAELSGWAVDDFKASQITGDPFYAYVDTERYEISLETPARVSVLRSHYSNVGGPSPAMYPVGDTFDLTTGTRLTFAGLFTCSEEEARQRVLDAVLALNAQGAYAGAVLDEGNLTAAFQPEQFYLTEDSLVCYFPDGDLPGAVGSVTFAVPYTDLEDILTPWK